MDEFFSDAAQYIVESTVIENYVKGSEESRKKYRERLTITLCKMFSPRKNYDISKETIRQFVGDVLTQLEQEIKRHEPT
ncbi:hypothetical protein WD019_18985 [Fictibacillus sp. Mic-4]|uniref:hypothetical protein n=1 Tax=Fictibacillus sp. Mic-4 TaxID=3132826 RepID=UPI003CE70991